MRVEDGYFPQDDLLGRALLLDGVGPRETLIDLHREQNGEWGGRESHRRLPRSHEGR